VYIHNNILPDCELRENRCSEKHSLFYLSGNTFLSENVPLIARFGRNSVQNLAHGYVDCLWVSWKQLKGRPCVLMILNDITYRRIP